MCGWGVKEWSAPLRKKNSGSAEAGHEDARDCEPPCDQDEWGECQKISYYRDDRMCSF
jgi:hypothetical protein